MMKEWSEMFFCREHGEVVYQISRGGIPIGMECRLGCEIDNLLDVRLGVGWLFTWEELGLEDNPFADDCRI